MSCPSAERAGAAINTPSQVTRRKLYWMGAPARSIFPWNTSVAATASAAAASATTPSCSGLNRRAAGCADSTLAPDPATAARTSPDPPEGRSVAELAGGEASPGASCTALGVTREATRSALPSTVRFSACRSTSRSVQF